MTVTVKLVGFLARQGLPAGFRGGEIEIGEGSCLADLLPRLGISANAPLMLTVNGRAAAPTQMLYDGDLVQIIPLIGGG